MPEPSNPYAPPTADGLPQSPARSFEYQPSHVLAVALRALLGLTVALLLINVWALQLQVELLERAATDLIGREEALANDRRVALAAGGFLLTLLGSGVVWCIWQSRISKNIRALGAATMRFGPHAWGWFFCPVVNLWRPLAVITELWESAPVPSSARARATVRADSPPSWLLGCWWLPWLLGHVISRVGVQTADSKQLDDLVAGTRYEMLAYLLLAASGVFAIAVVTLLQERVEARHQASQTKGLL